MLVNQQTRWSVAHPGETTDQLSRLASQSLARLGTTAATKGSRRRYESGFSISLSPSRVSLSRKMTAGKAAARARRSPHSRLKLRRSSECASGRCEGCHNAAKPAASRRVAGKIDSERGRKQPNPPSPSRGCARLRSRPHPHPTPKVMLATELRLAQMQAAAAFQAHSGAPAPQARGGKRGQHRAVGAQ